MTKTFVGLFFVMSIAWYIYVSNATTFESFVLIGNHIYNSIYAEFFELESREGAVRKLLGLEPAPSIWRQIGYGYYLLTQFFILVGLLALVRALVKGKRYLNFNDVHVAFSFVNVLWLAAALLPYFSSYMGISRLYHVMLFFLSPFCILGGEAFFKYTLKKVKSIRANRRMLDSILIFAVLLPYFFFSTGLVFEVVGDLPQSFSLGLERMENSQDIETIFLLNHEYKWPQEDAVDKWLLKNGEKNVRIWMDYFATGTFSFIPLGYKSVFYRTSKIPNGDYVLLRYMNVVNGIFVEPIPGYKKEYDFYNTSEIYRLLTNFEKSKIYDNGASKIWR
ncbi:DUF2206 domain-containing protein, partial [Candidatus Bathyarchaeota archaeon]|nr:DUF2206 domain-containing protein [Candidatus Bathyarchaeota archaeon]